MRRSQQQVPDASTGLAPVSSPTVSIGLPVYNGEQFLQDAIASILNQTFRDFELLIADNASTDRSLSIALDAAARDQRIRVLRSEMNRGAAWNYNRVVRQAAGQYFKWAAHDDVLAPQFIERCLAILSADPNVALAYTRAAEIDAQGERLFDHELPGYAYQSKPSDRVASVILNPSPCMESFGLTRRDQLLQTSLIGAYTASDRVLFLELALIGRFQEVPEVLFFHRQHADRSVRQYQDARARNVWFDPLWEGRRSAPRWRLFREYIRSTSRSPVRLRDRLDVSLPLARWVGRNARALAREALTHFIRPASSYVRTARGR